MLRDTGERILPKLMKPLNRMVLEHAARYDFAITFVKGRVLDMACGSGYGSQMVAKARKNDLKEIIAADICVDTLAYAKGNHYHPLVKFIKANALSDDLPDQLSTFNTILSFETIEHIEEDEKFVNNMYELLDEGGTFIVSTPFGEGRGVPCGSPFHIHQLTEDEFKQLFYRFSKVEFFYQRGALIEPPRENVHYPLGIAVCTK